MSKEMIHNKLKSKRQYIIEGGITILFHAALSEEKQRDILSAQTPPLPQRLQQPKQVLG
jgi:hypothetical protein